MNAKLIADAGSTKVEWALLPADGSAVKRFVSDGINAILADDDHIRQILAGVRKDSGNDCIFNEIHFYGAGCATPAICRRLSDMIADELQSDVISVSSDLLGAARSLLQKEKGIACILGTGSNSCLYDGFGITGNIPSLGYVLGDEGSGTAIGKKFIGDIFKGLAPDSVREKFTETFNLSLPDILDRVYRSSAPNKFLASFLPFIKENISNHYLRTLVYNEFSTFFSRNVEMYPGAYDMNICFTGSVAVNFEDILRDAASSVGLSVGVVNKSPMDGLLRYHAF